MRRKHKRDARARCRGEQGCCGRVDRRGFFKAAGVGAASVAAFSIPRPIMAGPFEASDFEKMIPADKKLDPAWVRSLFARGEPTVYSGAELEKIGMPVGGICAGHLYLGGDGRLWLWDIFNQFYHGVGGRGRNGQNYVEPMKPSSPLEQGFAIRVKAKGQTTIKALDRSGFDDVRFQGQYPIGRVEYRDPALPVSVELEAFSPFIPLNVDDSSYPATAMQYTIENAGKESIEIEVAGWMENAVCLYNGAPGRCVRRSQIVRGQNMLLLACSAEEPPKTDTKTAGRPDILFEDFEKPTYEGWTTTGTAFGGGPIEKAKMPGYQGDVGSRGKRLVNSHNTRQGEDVRAGDAHTGTLTSDPFTIERSFINFLVGGGGHKGKTCVNLLVGDKAVRTVTGRSDNRMQPHSFDVRDLAGKTARLQIVDDWTGGWGNIGIDHIVFSDTAQVDPPPLKELSDFGTMGLALLGPEKGDKSSVTVSTTEGAKSVIGSLIGGIRAAGALAPFGDKLVGALSRTAKLEPGEKATVTFLVTWHFPNLRLRQFRGPSGRYYAARFDSAQAVAAHVAANIDALSKQTRLWRDTWYDSTLPYWFLDRTFANVSILATSTCHRFANGRFYGWEGIGCCPGTCTHVWHYAQAIGRVFPALERDVRERVDYGLSFHADTGALDYRGEMGRTHAVDGQAGTILRAYREHQMSPDDAFLRRNWPKIRKSIEFLIGEDADGDGMMEGAQPNTLDAAWYGKIAWLTSLYLAALHAGEAMALEMGDGAFAKRARAILDRGSKAIVEQLWNGEYFIQIEDPKHMKAIGTGAGCHIDQVFGQGWAFQIGLGRLYSEKHIKQALESLWKHNFAPDVGPYKEVFTRGRPYALAGDAGLIMCTWPKGGRRDDWQKHWQFGYFNECMTGFEYQVAGHMVWEGMAKEGMAVTRAIHDRYHASLRNPWNEIECSDHYARAMASYGVYIAACGYEYHGPKGHLAFAPRLTPDNFRAAFTAAEGWGTFSQKREGRIQRETIEVKWGKLRVKSLAFELAENAKPTTVRVTAGGRPVVTRHTLDSSRIAIDLESKTAIQAGETLEIEIS